MTRPIPRGSERRHLTVFIILFGLCWLAGCGIQGPPQPPRVERPEKITDLKITQVGRTLEISFTLPRLAMDRERLTKPLDVELLRAPVSAGAKSPAPPDLGLWLALTPSEWSPYAQDRKVNYPVQLSVQEYKQWLDKNWMCAVRTLTHGFRARPHESENSNLVQVALLDVPVPVEDLKTQVTEKAIELNWTPPTRSLTGQPAGQMSGYHVYRSTTGKLGSYVFLVDTTAPHYADHEFQFAHTYFYRVRAVMKIDGRASDSEDSKVAEVRPTDTFPPAAPKGLTAVYAAGAVELVWNANNESDLAGYIVYRREDEQKSQRLNKDLLPTPIYRDATVQPGRKYLYYLIAVDSSGNLSSPSHEEEVETQ